MKNVSQVSFSKEIKEEICNMEVSPACRLGILSSFLKNNSSLLIGQNERIEIKTENGKIAKYIYILLKQTFEGINLSFRFRTSMHFKKHTEFIVVINDKIDNCLSALYLDFLSSKISYNLVRSEDGLKGYFMGLFLSSGSCSNPSTSNYHLEFSSKNEEFAKEILKLISRIKVYRFNFKIIKRRSLYVIYLKQSEAIASFLAYIEANNSALDFESLRLERDENNNLNRMENLDYYNYKKMIKKSEEIIDIIDKFDKKIGIENIQDEKLKAICYLKKEYPEVSYRELSKLASSKLGVTISKSSISRLISKIESFKDRYKL